MKRKTIRLGRGGKCGGVGASGFSTAARACSRPRRACKARKPKPPALRCNMARRVRVGRSKGMVLERNLGQFVRLPFPSKTLHRDRHPEFAIGILVKTKP